MKIEIIKAKIEHKEILRNLLEKYDYEFSQYDERDVNGFGLYGYKYLDHYWTEDSRWAFLVYVNKNLTGFVMINKVAESDERIDYSMSEFFIMYKYRRSGVGKYTAYQMFDMFKGKWQVKRHVKNKGAAVFWENVIKEYTKGNYWLKESYDDFDIILFET